MPLPMRLWSMLLGVSFRVWLTLLLTVLLGAGIHLWKPIKLHDQLCGNLYRRRTLVVGCLDRLRIRRARWLRP